MHKSFIPTISRTILAQVVDKQAGAMIKLNGIFGSTVVAELRRRGLAPADVEVLAVKVWDKVESSIHQFENRNNRTGSFRKWLKTVIGSVVIDHRRRFAETSSLPDEVMDVVNEFEQDIFRELRNLLQLLESDFSKSTIQAFELKLFTEKTNKMIGEELGLSPPAVTQACRRVRDRLQEENELFGDPLQEILGSTVRP